MKFDLPFLIYELKHNDLLVLLNSDCYGYAIDKYVLAKLL